MVAIHQIDEIEQIMKLYFMRCKPPNLYLSTQLCFKIHMLILAQHSAH
jgi:hypothetical protein